MLQIMASVQHWPRVMALLKEQLLLHLEHRQMYSKTENEALACIGWQKSGVPTPGAATLLFALTTVPCPHCFLQGSWMCRHDTCSTCLCFNYSNSIKLQSKFIPLAHATHQGMVRTKLRLRVLYWWPGMDCEVENAIKSCSTCSSTLSCANSNNCLGKTSYWCSWALELHSSRMSHCYDTHWLLQLMDRDCIHNWCYFCNCCEVPVCCIQSWGKSASTQNR